MSALSDYRASIQRLVAAENVEDAFKAEGFGVSVAKIVGQNKAFKASRSVGKGKPDSRTGQRGRMSHSKA